MTNIQEGVVDKTEQVVVNNSEQQQNTTIVTEDAKTNTIKEKCDTINVTLNEPVDEPVNRTRRAIYIFTVSAFSLISSAAFVVFGYESKIAEHYVLALLDLVEIIAIIYVTASVMDKSKLLSKIGDAVMERRSKGRDT